MTTATKARKNKAYTVPADVLRQALRTVAPAVLAKHATLHHVLLGHTVEATNGDLRISVDVGWFDNPVLVPFDRLNAIVAAVTDRDIRLTVEGEALEIRTARGQWRLPTADAAEWPARPERDARPLMRLPADQFCRCVAGVIDATDTESSRYALGGVLIEHRGPGVAFVATDGRRLHVALAEIDQATNDAAVVVPGRAMATISRVAAGHPDEAVQLELAGAELLADIANVTISVRLLEVRFPKWLEVIPQPLRPEFGRDDVPFREPPQHAEISVGELVAAVRQAAIVTSEQSKAVTFAFDEALTLTSQSAEGGQATVDCDLTQAGPACSVRLDPHFVLAWLKPLDSEAVVEIFATDGQSAVVLRHDDKLGVVMPMAAD